MTFPKSGTGIFTGVARTFKTEKECKKWEIDTRVRTGKVHFIYAPQQFDVTGGCKKVG